MQQQNSLTPVEILQLKKQQLQSACSEKERAIGENITYIQNNIGSILFSSLGSLIFKKSDNENVVNEQDSSDADGVLSGASFADYINIAKKFIPIGKEILIAYAIAKIKQWLSKL